MSFKYPIQREKKGRCAGENIIQRSKREILEMINKLAYE